MSMIPKGGDTIWGGIDWSPEEYCPSKRRKQLSNDTETSMHTEKETKLNANRVNYGRIISFGKDVAEEDPSKILRIEFRVRFFMILVYENRFLDFASFC